MTNKEKAIERAIEDIAAGKMVIVLDDEDRENEGDLIFAAEKATPELVAFMVRYSSGYICVSMDESECDRLQLPPMVAHNEDARGTAYRVTVDAATGSTGISAQSRAETIRRLAKPQYGPQDFTRPGHIVPLAASPGGVLERPGHTEAARDLAELAGLAPVGVLCEIVSQRDPADMARGPELQDFAQEHGIHMITMADLIAYRRKNSVQRIVETQLPTEYGLFHAIGYKDIRTGEEHIALVHGQGDNPLVRVHSECLTGDVFASRRCDCGPQLHSAMRAIIEDGNGIIIYMRGHEGRGIGLLAKLEAYNLQSQGLDTVEANLALGYPVDSRDFSAAIAILHDLGVDSLRLMSNNPKKKGFLVDAGFHVDMVHDITHIHEDNARYLQTKRDKMGHNLPEIESFLKEHDER